MRFNFLGGSYTSRSKTADAQRSMNLFPSVLESGQGKNKWALFGTPGLSAWSTLSNGPVRALWFDEVRDRVLAVGNDRLYSIASACADTDVGEMPTSPSMDTPDEADVKRTQ